MNRLFLLILLVAPLWATSAFADRIDIDNEKLQTLIDEGVPVVDVRRLDEWKSTGIIKGIKILKRYITLKVVLLSGLQTKTRS